MRNRRLPALLVLSLATALVVAMFLGRDAGPRPGPAPATPTPVPSTASGESEQTAPLGSAASSPFSQPAPTGERLEASSAPAAAGAPKDGERVTLRVTFNQSRHVSQPIAAVDFQAGIGNSRDPSVPVLAEGITDANGVVELHIPWTAVAEPNDTARVWVRPVSSEWRNSSVARAWPKEPGVLELTIVGKRGTTVRGRMFAPDGRPVAGRISAQGVTAFGKETHGFGSAAANGWFELHVNDPGRFQIVGSVRTVSYAWLGVLRDVDIGTETPADTLELTLQGAGVLRGTVRDAGGRPMPGLELDVAAFALSDLEYSEYAHLRGQLDLEGLGGAIAKGRTDAEGGFEIVGLRTDRFLITTGTDRLTPTPVQSDGEPLNLVLDGTRLLVRVLDAAGRPWEGELNGRKSPLAASSQSETDGPVWAKGGWPESPKLIVEPAREDLVTPAWNEPDRRIRGRRVGPSSFSYEVEPGRDYLLGLLGGHWGWNPERVHVPATGGRVDVDLTLPEAAEFGTLELVVTADTGLLTGGIAVRIEDPHSGRPLIEKTSFARDTWPLKLRLPAGGWNLVVEGEAETDFFHGTLQTPRSLGAFETAIHITPDTSLRIEAHLPKGAQIDLNLAGEATDADREAIATVWGEQDTSWTEWWAGRARVTLVAEERWPLEVPFRYTTTGTSAAGLHKGSYLSIGTRQVSEIVPAGTYTLQVSMPGGRTAEAAVTLVDGQTTAVSLEL